MDNTILIFMLMTASLIFCIFAGYYLFAVLGGLGFLFGLIFWGTDVANVVYMEYYGAVRNYTLLAIPLFVFMGNMLQQAGVAEKLFEKLGAVLGGLKGGLALSAMLISILFAASTGIVGASVVTMGVLCLPAMLRRGYNKGFASGAICAGGTLGILIPPSIMLVVYGATAGLSVGKLFYGAMIPGILMGLLYMVYIVIIANVKPDYGPGMPIEELRGISSWQKITGVCLHVVPVLGLILSVLGTIWFGIAPPTEAAAIGAFAAVLLALAYGKFTYKNLRAALHDTVTTSSMIFAIIIFAGMFVAVFTRLGGGDVINRALLSLPVGKWPLFVMMMIGVFILGMFMDWVASILIIIPIVTPIAGSLGFDAVWFAIAVCVVYQTSFLTPPFAYSIFYLKGVAPPEVSTNDIIGGIWPYIGVQVATLILVVIFPELVTWLPGKMVG